MAQLLGNITNSILQMNGLASKMPKTDQPVKSNESEANQDWLHPIITPDDFSKTLNNYRKYITIYNKKVRSKNRPIDKYNIDVRYNERNYIKSKEEEIEVFFWRKKHKGLEPVQYNEAVDKFNNKHGKLLRKIHVLKEVKSSSEKFFAGFLHYYQQQLYARKNKYQQPLPDRLPKYHVFPNLINRPTKDGVEYLNASYNTIREHRDRLIEAGVLRSYKFHGGKKAVSVAFNEDILSLTDNVKNKKTKTENQSVTALSNKKVGDKNVSSRNISLVNNQYRDKGNSNSKFELNEASTEITTKTPQGKLADFENGLSENAQLSKVLSTTLLQKGKLARELTAQKYADYKPLDLQILQSEAYYGNMHPDDFKELAIQDIFKFSNDIFSDLSGIHPGAWTNAIKYWQKDKFISFTGKTLSKTNLLGKWQKAIEVLREVKKYKNTNDQWQPRFPSLYFDPARVYKENNCFEYALQNFNLDEVDVKPKSKRKKEALNEINKKSRTKTDLQKALDMIRKYLRDDIELQRLYNYVEANCKTVSSKNLQSLIIKEMHKN